MMARALDFCDAMMPGMHVGSSSVHIKLAELGLSEYLDKVLRK